MCRFFRGPLTSQEVLPPDVSSGMPRTFQLHVPRGLIGLLSLAAKRLPAEVVAGLEALPFQLQPARTAGLLTFRIGIGRADGMVTCLHRGLDPGRGIVCRSFAGRMPGKTGGKAVDSRFRFRGRCQKFAM